MNLYGTKLGGDPDYLDTYIDNRHTAQTNTYIIYGEDLYKFFEERYGGETIKRFYIRKGMLYTTVEVKLHALKTKFFNADLIQRGVHPQSIYKNWWSQVSDNATLKDVKKRCVDHLKSAGFEISADQIRLWLYSQSRGSATTIL